MLNTNQVDLLEFLYGEYNTGLISSSLASGKDIKSLTN